MELMEDRVDASLLTAEERGLLQPLADLAQRNEHPCLKGSDGTEITLPEAIFQVLVKVIDGMRHGKAIVLVREDETFTTQASANFLGMSRPHFVSLLEKGQIPFHRVGSHRRVYFKDLRDFARKRDDERRDGLNRLFKDVMKAGLYDASYTGEK